MPGDPAKRYKNYERRRKRKLAENKKKIERLELENASLKDEIRDLESANSRMKEQLSAITPLMEQLHSADDPLDFLLEKMKLDCESPADDRDLSWLEQNTHLAEQAAKASPFFKVVSVPDQFKFEGVVEEGKDCYALALKQLKSHRDRRPPAHIIGFVLREMLLQNRSVELASEAADYLFSCVEWWPSVNDETRGFWLSAAMPHGIKNRGDCDSDDDDEDDIYVPSLDTSQMDVFYELHRYFLAFVKELSETEGKDKPRMMAAAEIVCDLLEVDFAAFLTNRQKPGKIIRFGSGYTQRPIVACMLLPAASSNLNQGVRTSLQCLGELLCSESKAVQMLAGRMLALCLETARLADSNRLPCPDFTPLSVPVHLSQLLRDIALGLKNKGASYTIGDLLVLPWAGFHLKLFLKPEDTDGKRKWENKLKSDLTTFGLSLEQITQRLGYL